MKLLGTISIVMAAMNAGAGLTTACKNVSQPIVSIVWDSNNNVSYVTLKDVTKITSGSVKYTSTAQLMSYAYCQSQSADGTSCTDIATFHTENITTGQCKSKAIDTINGILANILNGTLTTSQVNTSTNGTTVDSSPSIDIVNTVNAFGQQIASMSNLSQLCSTQCTVSGTTLELQ